MTKTKREMMDALTAANIAFEENASAATLRELYREMKENQSRQSDQDEESDDSTDDPNRTICSPLTAATEIRPTTLPSVPLGGSTTGTADDNAAAAVLKVSAIMAGGNPVTTARIDERGTSRGNWNAEIERVAQLPPTSSTAATVVRSSADANLGRHLAQFADATTVVRSDVDYDLGRHMARTSAAHCSSDESDGPRRGRGGLLIGRSCAVNRDEYVQHDEMDALRRERDALLLQLEVSELRARVAAPAPTVAVGATVSADTAAQPEHNSTTLGRARLDFGDIEHALPKFAGDDKKQDVHTFFREFEDIMTLVHANDSFKFLSLRRTLKGAARSLLEATTAVTYEQLKEVLVDEFDISTTREDIYRLLRQNKWKRGTESMHHYVIRMRTLSRRANVPESELVGIIVDGLGESSANSNLLLSARDVRELKELMNRHESRFHRAAPTTTAAASSVNAATSARRPSGNRAEASTADQPQCYNCSQRGHIKPDCPYTLRNKDDCFRCWKPGHTRETCSNQRMKLVLKTDAAKAAAAAKTQAAPAQDDDDADLAQQFDAINMVSVAQTEEGNRGTNFTRLLSLFDTGSPSSFIKRKFVTKTMPNSKLPTNLRGLGGHRLEIYGRINCRVQFNEQIFSLNIAVVPDDAMIFPLILGRDFLDAFGIKLTKRRKLSYPKDKLIEIKEKMKNMPSFSAPKLNETSSILEKHSLCKPPKPTLPIVSPHLPAGPPTNAPPGPDAVLLPDASAESPELPMSPDELATLLYGKLNGEFMEVFSIDIPDDKLNVGEKLDLGKRAELETMFSTKYFSTDVTAEPYDYEMQIHLTTDVPFHCSPRRLSYHERDEVQKMVNQLMAEGIVRPSNSPYASAIVLVKKKSGELRMCVDYRGLNKLTVRDNYPLPLIEDCIEYLEGKRCFSVLDLKSGFHQVRVADSSTRYTSFVTPGGQYEYTRMPFGLKNAPAVFQRFINEIFRDMIAAHEVVIYMDDILLATPDYASHCRLLSRVLERLRYRGLQLNLKKCQICFDEIEYLGYAVTADGIRPSGSHLEAIRRYPVPTNAKEVQSCMGLFSYFRRFVESFSRIAAPLRKLIVKDALFTWDEACANAFAELKGRLVSAPVLAIYKPSRETELHTDASSHGFGAALMQKQDDGRFHPVAYYSRATSDAESRYHSFELETLAIIYALKRFRAYLEGIPFKMVTDCNSLTMTLAKRNINPRIARWALEFENYDYTVVHRGGASMTHVDALSRCRQIAAVNEDEVDFRLRLAQARDQQIEEMRCKLEKRDVPNFQLTDGVVFRVNSERDKRMWVPSDMEDNVIRLVHEMVGHQSVDKTVERIKQHYWIPGCREKAKGFIERCLDCLMYATPASMSERNLHMIPKRPVPFDTIHIDHFGPLPAIQSKRKHILVVVDAFTKYVKLYPVVSTSTREVTASLEKYFGYYSRPRRVVSDRGTCFTSAEFEDFPLKRNIDHVRVATASPQANGQVERMNRVLKAMLGKMTEPILHADWTKLLESVEYAMNNSTHRSTGETASRLLFGVDQRGKVVDKLTEYLDAKINADRKELS